MRKLFLSIATFFLFAGTAYAADDTFSCIGEHTGPVIKPKQTTGYIEQQWTNVADRTLVDARGITILQETYPTVRNDYPIDVRTPAGGNNRVCVAGLMVKNTNPLSQSWSNSKHPNNAGVFFTGGRLTVDGGRFFNTHDAIRPARDRPSGVGNGAFVVRNNWITFNRDDCIENDHARSGLVEDNLFDGCYSFISTRQAGGSSGANETVTIRNNIIRMQPMPGPYGGSSSDLGHGLTFKMQAGSPGHIVENNIFYFERAPYHGEAGFPSAYVKTCRNNIVVWGGSGKFPGVIPGGDSCARVTTDVSVFTKARAQWIADHPLVPRLPGDPFTVSTSLSPKIVSVAAAEPTPVPEPVPVPTPKPLQATLMVSLSDDPDKADGRPLDGLITEDQGFWVYLVTDDTRAKTVSFDVTGFDRHTEGKAPWDIGPRRYAVGDYAVKAIVIDTADQPHEFNAIFHVIAAEPEPEPEPVPDPNADIEARLQAIETEIREIREMLRQ